MADQPDDLILREKARAAMHSGRLSSRRPDITRGGAGCGGTCDVCGKRIPRYQMEVEIDFTNPEPPERYHLHPRCLAAWEIERTKADDNG